MTTAEALNPIRSLKATFEAMNLQTSLWGGAILLLFVEQMAGVGGQFAGPVVEQFGEEAIVFVLCGSCVAMVGVLVLAAWLQAGLFLNMRAVVKTGEPAPEGQFDHQGKFVPLLLTKLLVLLASCVLMIPGLVVIFVSVFLGVGIGEGVNEVIGVLVMILGSLVGYAVMILCIAGVLVSECAVILEELTPTEAIKRSWDLASGKRLRIVLFFFVNAIFSMLGLLLGCVGGLATGSIARLATVEAFLQLTGGGDAADVNQASDSGTDNDIDLDERRVLHD